MHILVLMRMVPDVVEELEVAPDGKALATDFLRLIINERDNHALEEALRLREAGYAIHRRLNGGESQVEFRLLHRGLGARHLAIGGLVKSAKDFRYIFSLTPS